MIGIGLLVLAVSGWFQTATATESGDVMARYQFADTQIHRNLALDAVDLVNSVLGETSSNLISPHWHADEVKPVRLYWVGSRNLTKDRNDMMFVVTDCSCIVVQPLVFMRWLSSYSGDAEDDKLLALSAPHVLAYFLLHEIGHIVNGDAGRALSGARTMYNLDPTVSKQQESAADHFAANALKAAAGDTSAFKRSMAALWVGTELQKLSFNLTGIRLIDEFGGTALALPKLFMDRGASHPNFELRVLEISDQISGTPESRSLVEDFRALQRASARRDSVIYRAPDASNGIPVPTE